MQTSSQVNDGLKGQPSFLLGSRTHLFGNVSRLFFVQDYIININRKLKSDNIKVSIKNKVFAIIEKLQYKI